MVQSFKQKEVAHEGEAALSAHEPRFKSGRFLLAGNSLGGQNTSVDETSVQFRLTAGHGFRLCLFLCLKWPIISHFTISFAPF